MHTDAEHERLLALYRGRAPGPRAWELMALLVEARRLATGA
ncbi:MAG TPA: hypothetical protein VL738_37080 [Dactylosporangium sp.]|nr:hypothetical protein [Dactylosporangium sp.]